MSKMQLGLLLIFSPFIFIALTLVIVHHFDVWSRAINKYKELNDPFELVLVTILTVFEIMFLTGAYLILTK